LEPHWMVPGSLHFIGKFV